LRVRGVNIKEESASGGEGISGMRGEIACESGGSSAKVTCASLVSICCPVLSYVNLSGFMLGRRLLLGSGGMSGEEGRRISGMGGAAEAFR
jgi:hypothetical protein